MWSTLLGGATPLIVLMLIGVLLATHESSLATAANPIGVIQAALPAWAAVPYLIAAAGGLIVEADLSLYSSGLNLLNMFVPLERYKTVVIDAVIMVLGTVFSGPLATGIFAESSLEVVFAFLVGGVLYLILTPGRGASAAHGTDVPADR